MNASIESVPAGEDYLPQVGPRSVRSLIDTGMG
jgi:hypothetical protein